MYDLQIAELIGRVEHLTVAVERLIETQPPSGLLWLTPSELAKAAGVTPRAISKWRAAGAFRADSLRPHGNSYQYHRKHALQDIENRRQG